MGLLFALSIIGAIGFGGLTGYSYQIMDNTRDDKEEAIYTGIMAGSAIGALACAIMFVVVGLSLLFG